MTRVLIMTSAHTVTLLTVDAAASAEPSLSISVTSLQVDDSRLRNGA